MIRPECNARMETHRGPKESLGIPLTNGHFRSLEAIPLAIELEKRRLKWSGEVDSKNHRLLYSCNSISASIKVKI